jgi:phage-related protein
MRPSPPKSPLFQMTCRRGSCASLNASHRPGSEPHVKHLEGKLLELRLTGRDGIARALYVTEVGRRVVVVRAFVKKSRKTPRAEIELAPRRAKEVA